MLARVTLRCGLAALTGMVLAAVAVPYAAAGATATTLYVATTGTNSGNCESTGTPCLTIQYAVNQAELSSGAVVIQIAGGTYAEQVTIAPPSSSRMTSLTLQGPTSGTAAVVEPTSLVANVTEGNTGHFADNNTGNTDAVIGAQTGSTDSALTSAPAGNGASVTVANLTVNGSQITGTSPTSTPASTSTSNPFTAPWEGIALIDTSGTVMANTVEHIQNSGVASGDSSVLGIAVKSTHVSTTVRVTGNTVQNYGGAHAINLMAASPGILSASVTGNTLTGDPTDLTAPAAQFGIVAGGLTDLSVSDNTISDFQSPWSVGAVWLDRQASGATCSVTGNTLTTNDNGVDVHGASGCTITGNTITTGSAGVEIGPGFISGLPSNNIVVADNSVAGTVTEATAHWYTGAATVADAPVDGVLVWDGTGTTISRNSISGFVSDVYVGEDPVYLNNTATWGTNGIPSPYSGYHPGATVNLNDLASPATPASGSGISKDGVACLNSNGACTSSSLAATNNWWGSASGPGSIASGSGVPVSAHVSYTPWLAGVSLSPGAQNELTGSSTTETATLLDNTGAKFCASLAYSFTTSPSVGDSAGNLSCGSASFSFTDGAAGPVTVTADIGFGTYVASPVPSPSMSSLGASANVSFTAPPPSPPTISSISPTTGPVAGGTTVTIIGTNFSGAAFVDFGSVAAKSFTVVSGTEITAVSPAGTSTVNVTVVTPGGTSTTRSTDLFTYVSPVGYHPITSTRICDTRSGNPSKLSGAALTNCFAKAPGTAQVLTIDVAGLAGIPADATAVALDITAIDPSANGYLAVYPAGGAKPGTSSVNFTAGSSATANLVMVALPTSGQVSIYNSAGITNVAVDVEGYVGPETTPGTGLYTPLSPSRICDTRAGNPSGLSGAELTNCEGKAPPAGTSLEVPVLGLGGVPASNVSAVVATLTAIDPTAGGYLTAYPAGTSVPTASQLNYVSGRIVANSVIVPVGSSGAIEVYSSSGRPNIAIDVEGYFTGSANPSASGSVIAPAATPSRICDTRAGNPSGLSGAELTNCEGKTLSATSPLDVQVTGLAGVPADATAVIVNLTATDTTASSYLTAYPAPSAPATQPAGTTSPLTSVLNWQAGQTRADLAIVPVGSGGQITLSAGAGSTAVIVDVVGWMVPASG